MQHVANIAILTPSLRARLDLFFATLGQGVNAYAVRRKRLGELARLDAMSDAELLNLGITRDRIPHYVFRDLFSVQRALRPGAEARRGGGRRLLRVQRCSST